MEPATSADIARSALIADYGIQMTLVFLIAVIGYTIVALRDYAKIIIWYRANGFRFGLCMFLFWLISAAIVMVPTFSALAGSLGLNFDQGTAGVGLTVAGFLIKNQSHPQAIPVEVVHPDKEQES